MTIVVDQVSFAYGRRKVLQDVAARGEAGSITAVLGPNAAGKSTLLRCMIGSLRPQTGAVLIDGQPVHAMSARQLAQRIAYVSQRSMVSAAFTARQVVELGRFVLPLDPKRVDEALARLDLVDVGDRLYSELSAGQQQRVTLARAIAQLDPHGHLVLDEPTSAMDLRHVNLTMKLLQEKAANGATVIMAMHDLSLAAATAHHAWLLDQGRLISSGSAVEVLDIQRLAKVFGVRFRWIQTDGAGSRLLSDVPASASADKITA